MEARFFTATLYMTLHHYYSIEGVKGGNQFHATVGTFHQPPKSNLRNFCCDKTCL